MDKNQLSLASKLALKELYKRDAVKWFKEQVWSFDEHDKTSPVKKLPVKEYTEALIREWQKEPILHIAKSRQMQISWLAMAMCLHEAQFYQFQLEAVFSKKEEDAHALVERAKFIYSNQQTWLQELCPVDRKMRDMPYGSLFFKNGSKIKGLAQGKDQVRSYVPSTAVIDEAAFQDKLEETYGACVPCSSKIVTISSAESGFFQRLCEL